jgi:subtilisin-like proprotein convertase family protein
MSGHIAIHGKYGYKIDSATNTVTLQVEELQNTGVATTGAVRLELWLTTSPWNPTAGNSGWEIANDLMGGGGNAALAPGATFGNITDTVAIKKLPPAGTYFVTLAAAQYNGASPTVDEGYVINDSVSFPTLVTVGADGSVKLSSITMPGVSIETEDIMEGNSGTQAMTFTLSLSKAATFPVSVQVDTVDETALAGVDYQAVHKTVTFAPGTTTATVSVPIIGNTTFGPVRAFEVNLSNPMGATITPNTFDPTGAPAGTRVLPDAWGFIEDDDTPASLNAPKDDLFPLQWYLFSTGVEWAWQHATGKGIKVAVFDQGIDKNNPDLAASDNLGLDRAALTMASGGTPVTASDNHGTQVAGIIAAARDGTGMVGVAYDAKLVSLYTPSIISKDYVTEITNAFHYAAAMDVLNNSWGFGNLLAKGTNWAFLDNAKDPLFAPAFDALRDLAAKGRGGLGTVVVQSAGNGFDFGDDTNLHNFQNSRYIITVGATDSRGESAIFSTTGASILVAAPGGAGYGDFESIITTDRTGAAGASPGNYAFNDGTSFSAPIVSGIVALMLEANPKLGYRDVQQILAYTAEQRSKTDTYAFNGAHDWNGGGLQYDDILQSTGFGVVDALAAVRLAAAWDTAPRTSANVVDVTASTTINLPIPDNNRSGIGSTITIDSNMVVERVDVTVNATHPFIGDLEIGLRSPSGTISYLMYRPSQGTLSAVGSSQHDIHFTFDTVLVWGESAKGDWSINVRDLATGNTGTFDSWSIDLIGHEASNDHTFVYTSMYADVVAKDAKRAMLSDPSGGNDTINAAALGTNDRIDLSGLTPSTIDGAQLTIAQGTTIRNAYGGDGNNVLIANDKGSLLRGMAGNDTLTGGAGNDTLDGGHGNDIIDGGAGLDTAVYHGARSGYTLTRTASGFTLTDKSAVDGIDQLAQVERIKFTDVALAFDVDGNGGQAFRIYQAAFNRTPDAAGLGYWMGQMDGGMTLLDVAKGFVQSSEFKDLYGAAPSDADIVNRFYSNVLHRTADAAGAAFWTKLLDDHSLTTAEVLAQFSESPENKAALVGVTQNGIEYQPFV